VGGGGGGGVGGGEAAGGGSAGGGDGAGGGGDVNECLTDNGGCDVHATCTDIVGGRTCACNAGYAGTGLTCLWDDPRLTALSVPPGALVFDPATTHYTVGLPSGTTSVLVTPVVSMPDRATIEVNGQPVASGASLEVPFIGPSTTVVVTVTAESGAQQSYTVLLTSVLTHQNYLKASNPTAAAAFGWTVAASADGTTLAIAALREPSNATGIDGDQSNVAGATGAVYVFVRSGSTWVQQAYVKPSNTAPGYDFGVSLALSADGNTLAVGASGEKSLATGVGGDETNRGGSSCGAVYVFARSGTAWGQQAYVKASNTNSGDYFGFSVALSASGDTLAVGAFKEDSKATGVGGNQADNTVTDSGAVYVYTRSGTAWSSPAYLKQSYTRVFDYFGRAVALSADGNTLAVGAYGQASSATGVGGTQTGTAAVGSGAVYVFLRGSGSGVWAQEAFVKASNTGANDNFGYNLALSADGTSLAVGAPGESSASAGVGGTQSDDSAAESGAVYVFAKGGAGWAQEAYVKASNPGVRDSFGYGLALSGDGKTLAVGAMNESSSAIGIDGPQANDLADRAGAAYVFTRAGAGWSQLEYVKASNTEAVDLFGRSLALSADGAMLVVGAEGEDSSATGVGGDQTDNSVSGSGAAYVLGR
jgi:hypothetical protein